MLEEKMDPIGIATLPLVVSNNAVMLVARNDAVMLVARNDALNPIGIADQVRNDT